MQPMASRPVYLKLLRWAVIGLALVAAAGRPAVGAEAPKPDKPAPEPWEVAGPVRPFAETCFEDFQTSGGVTAKEVGRWLAPVEGHPLAISDAAGGATFRGATVKGWARLRAPWGPDAVLRLTLSSPDPIELHFWSGGQGLTLSCRRVDNRPFWAAYRITRRPLEPIVLDGQKHEVVDPGLALLTTDDQRAGRTATGTCEIRYQDRALVMTQGDIRLLTAPLESPPEEIYLEGKSFLLRDIAMVRGPPAPDDPPAPRRAVVEGSRPAGLAWRSGAIEGSQLARLGDGGVTLRSRGASSLAWASVPLPRTGLYEIVFEVEGFTFGTGVYLGDDQGQRLQGIEFARDSRSGRTMFTYSLPPSYAPAHANIVPAPVAWAGPRQWLRLTCVAGTFKCWTSGDGVHWGQALAPLAQPGSFSQVGLYCQPGDEPRAISVRTLRICELDGLTSPVPRTLVQQAESLGMVQPDGEGSDLGAWEQRVWEIQPEGVPPDPWRRACALAALAGPADPRLSRGLLEQLALDALNRPGPSAMRIRALQDFALAWDPTSWEDYTRFMAVYERFCRDLLVGRDPAELGETRRVLATLPLWMAGNRIDVLTERSTRDQLIALWTENRWPELHRFGSQLHFWNQPPEPHTSWPGQFASLKELAGQLTLRAAAELPDKPGRKIDRRVAGWSDPATVPVDKESSSVLTEIRAALRVNLVDDACRILTAAPITSESSLVADTADPGWFPSMAVAVEEMIGRHAPLFAAMNRESGGVDRLRLQQLLTEANTAALEGFTVRYCGTPVASEAQAWLGDRLMAGADFWRAISRYRKAMTHATAEQKGQLDARLRLAHAMLGRAWGSPAAGAVRFGEVQWPADQFERVVAAMLKTHGGKADAATAIAQDAPANGHVAIADEAVAGPVGMEARAWKLLEGDFGQKPQEVPWTPRPEDWTARQTAIAAAGDRLVVANRFQVWCFGLGPSASQWTYAPKSSPASAYAWPMVPMRPKIVGRRVLVRLFGEKERPQIVCLDLESGKPVWTTRYGGDLLCDPEIVQGRVVALAADLADNQPFWPLMVASFDPEDGTLLESRWLADLRREWQQHRACQMTVAGGKLLATVGGATVCCDLLERVDWVRQSAWTPAANDPDAVGLSHEPPRVAGQRVVVAQPGVYAVECVDLSSGRLLWRRAVPRLRRVLLADEERVIVEAADELVALATSGGELLWRREAPQCLDGFLAAASAGLLFATRDPLRQDEACPVLTWCDPATGRLTASWPLTGLASKQPLLGPMLEHQGRIWALTGTTDAKGAPEPKRSIVELTPTGPALRGEIPSRPWNAAVDPRIRTAASQVLPGWTLLAAASDDKTGLRAPQASMPEVLVTKAAETPVRLARAVQVPAGASTRLAFELGHDPSASSRLEVRVAGLPRLRTAIQPSTTAAPWQQWQLDLTEFAGHTVWITVVQESTNGTPAYAWWKRLEIIPDKQQVALHGVR